MLLQGIEKTCRGCKTAQPITNFQKSKKTKDGVLSLCRDCERERKAVWRRNNLEKHNATNALWILNNPDKQKESERKWRAFNKGTKNAATARRRSFKLKATPSWSDTVKIKAYYDICSFFNEVNGYTKYHVDHIIPLQSDVVCGLHVHTNLQVMLATENYAKGNKWN